MTLCPKYGQSWKVKLGWCSEQVITKGVSHHDPRIGQREGRGLQVLGYRAAQPELGAQSKDLVHKPWSQEDESKGERAMKSAWASVPCSVLLPVLPLVFGTEAWGTCIAKGGEWI